MCKKTFLIVFVLFLPIFVFSQDTINKIVPAETLFKQQQQHSFKISPDGKSVALAVENDVNVQILIVDIDKYAVTNRIPVREKTIQDIMWLSSKRILYEAFGEIFAIDIDGSNKNLLVSRMASTKTKNWNSFYRSMRYSSVVSLYPESENEILIQDFDLDFYASIKRVNVFTGEKKTVINGRKHKINKWVLDPLDNIRLGVKTNDDGYSYLMYNADSDECEEFYVYIDGQSYPLNISANSYLKQPINFEGFGFNPDIIYLTINVNSDKRKLVSYNIKEKQIVKTLVNDTNCDVNDPINENLCLMFDYGAKKLIGVRYESLTPKHIWFSEDYSEISKKLEKISTDFFNDIIGTSINKERLLINQWSDNYAGNVGVYTLETDKYVPIVQINEELNGYKLSKSRVLIAQARDDYKLPCYVNLPNNKSESEMPLVVIPHGGPWARDYWALDGFAQYFVSRGYAVLRVNYRGSTGFGKKHLLSGVSSIDNIMINDIADATTYVTEKYQINKNEIFIFGHSYGGYATYMSLLKYPNIFASGVALSAPSDIKKWMKTKKKEKEFFTYEFWETALGNNGSKYFANISPINYVSEFKSPMLIFHGKRDEIIPVEQAEIMIDELKKANVDAELEILQNEGHSILDSNSLGYILDSSNKFFKKTAKN